MKTFKIEYNTRTNPTVLMVNIEAGNVDFAIDTFNENYPFHIIKEITEINVLKELSQELYAAYQIARENLDEHIAAYDAANDDDDKYYARIEARTNVDILYGRYCDSLTALHRQENKS